MAIITSNLFCKINDVNIFNIPEGNSKPVVIQLLLFSGAAGTERAMLAQNIELLAQGVLSVIICKEKTFLSEAAKNLGLPVITCTESRIGTNHFVTKSTLTKALKECVSRFSNNLILAIHCHFENDIITAKKAAPNIPTILTKHYPGNISLKIRTLIDGFIGVSKALEIAFQEANQQNNINCVSTTLPPFFDDKKFVLYLQLSTKEDFFKTTFGITLKNCPLLLKIANLYENIEHKNHPLLFRAMKELIYERNFPIQVALAGEGENFEMYKKMVNDLGISDYVYFLGKTNFIPDLAQHADINLLTSKEEAFGIALLEGGMMKKPTIIAKGTGAADWLIIDKKTGFLFENNNVQSLADTIQYVLANKKEAASCGDRLYEKVKAEFIPARNIEKLINFYHAVTKKTHPLNLLAA